METQELDKLIHDIIIMGYSVMKEEGTYYISIPNECDYEFWLNINPDDEIGMYELHYSENYKQYMEHFHAPEECLELLKILIEQFN